MIIHHWRVAFAALFSLSIVLPVSSQQSSSPVTDIVTTATTSKKSTSPNRISLSSLATTNTISINEHPSTTSNLNVINLDQTTTSFHSTTPEATSTMTSSSVPIISSGLETRVTATSQRPLISLTKTSNSVQVSQVSHDRVSLSSIPASSFSQSSSGTSPLIEDSKQQQIPRLVSGIIDRFVDKRLPEANSDIASRDYKLISETQYGGVNKENEMEVGKASATVAVSSIGQSIMNSNIESGYSMHKNESILETQNQFGDDVKAHNLLKKDVSSQFSILNEVKEEEHTTIPTTNYLKAKGVQTKQITYSSNNPNVNPQQDTAKTTGQPNCISDKMTNSSQTAEKLTSQLSNWVKPLSFNLSLGLTTESWKIPSSSDIATVQNNSTTIISSSESILNEKSIQRHGRQTQIRQDTTTKNIVTAVNQWPVKHSAVVEGDLILGGLMMVHEREDSVTCGPIMPQGGVQALEAMLYTLDKLNQMDIVPGVKIGAHILDDCDKDTYGLEMAVDFIKGE
ncbi:hypothetical protein QAD02_011989 [Eretmocerus hayati]|uniref:Uncharacterized protein n=1 Tax=Eretmocerus hayati TaxID=131215 RepID=A0ACC2NZ99_9HYME|nr:hypothetical protein QAD02_011989 [Eretmocerus hayati]